MVSRRVFIKILAASLVSAMVAPVLLARLGDWLLAGRRTSRPREWAISGSGGETCLPPPRLTGPISLEEAMANRRSIRSYKAEPLDIEEVAQLLWAAYGVTETRYGFKTTPSAGATYPLEVYLVAAPRGVRTGKGYLEPGSYHYNPYSHCIRLVRRGNLVPQLYEAGLRQPWIKNAPVNIVITAVYERTMRVYGERGRQYVHMEVGHAGQNIYLQATAMGLATVAVGAFYDDMVRETIGAGEEEVPLYIMPVGRPTTPYRLDPEKLLQYYRAHRG